MPIFVQWKWKERTKTFLIIFHFWDDYSKPSRNIRFKMKKFKDEKSKIKFERPTITWAPSHPELGLLSELLSYANIINGLKETEKRELRRALEIAVDEGNGYLHLYWAPIEHLLQLPHKMLFETTDYVLFFPSVELPLLHVEKEKIEEDSLFCVELRPEYIDYLKTVLKPYLK